MLKRLIFMELLHKFHPHFHIQLISDYKVTSGKNDMIYRHRPTWYRARPSYWPTDNVIV